MMMLSEKAGQVCVAITQPLQSTLAAAYGRVKQIRHTASTMDTDESKESSDTTPVTEESSASPINRTKQTADSALGTPQAAGPLAENFDQNTGPSPIHCLGARAYDGGYFDVGSFFVFRRKPSDERRGAGFPVGEDRALISSVDHSSEQAPSALGYVLLDGLTVKTCGAEKKQVEGSGSGGALRAFSELQRQADVIGQALGCVDPFEKEGTADAPEVTANGASREGGGGAQECLALGNTDNNESVQGLVRSAGCLWLGVFGLPPVPSGEEEEIVDLWPRKVARFTEDGVAGVLALEGKPDATGPLAAPKGEGGESDTIAGACEAYSLIARALAELRPFVPAPPDPYEAARTPTAPNRSSVLYAKKWLKGEALDAADTATNGHSGKTLSLDDSEVEEDGGEEGEEEEEAFVGEKRPVTARALSTRSGGRKSAPAPGKRRAGRRRRRMTMSSYQRRSLRDDGGLEEEEEEGDAEGSRARKKRGKRGVVPEADDEADDNHEGARRGAVGVGAGEMTVAAVRTSLLRNRADEGPKPQGEEWEETVKRFIKHVENLPAGTTQEELSLMFAAALDPTLVRMRAANASLIGLAEVSASRELSIHDADDDDDEDDEGGHDGYEDAWSATRGNRGRGRFKVRLELDATDGDEPPPEGIAGLLRAVAEARAAVEATARAEACVAAAGDTLGGLQELKSDYKRSLPTGPREPIQLIIAEEQERVVGYKSAHEIIVRQRIEELRDAGSRVGEAYRTVEEETGWSSVKLQVDKFLRKFTEYSVSRLPSLGSTPDLLGLGIAGGDVRGSAASRV